ncbi:MAG: serine/threonine protein phosphatase [Firmicutes bacterium]|nr:serine/threonine protein phosphatase [Bacillota bacterium]
MDIFGEQWIDHHLKIEENWRRTVKDDDTVILGGDLSWALKLEEAEEDLNYIHSLPGKKVLFKGNHDYWWQSYAKVKEALPENVFAVQNNYFPYEGGIALCGTRGWIVPGTENFSEHDEKIYKRELNRLKLSLTEALKDGYRKFIVTLHYPPFTPWGEETGFVEIMRDFDVKICLYGHLHGVDEQKVVQGEIGPIRYYFTSCDYLQFSPIAIDVSVFDKV